MVWESIRQNTNIHQYSTTNDGFIFTNIHQYLPSFITFYLSCFYGKILCLQSWLFHDPTVSPCEVNIRITLHQGNIMIQAGTFHHSNIFKSTWKPTIPTICYGIPSGWNIYEELFHWFQIKMIHPGVNEHSHGNHDYLGGFPTIHLNSPALLGGAVPVVSGYGCIYIYIIIITIIIMLHYIISGRGHLMPPGT